MENIVFPLPSLLLVAPLWNDMATGYGREKDGAGLIVMEGQVLLAQRQPRWNSLDAYFVDILKRSPCGGTFMI